MDGSGRPSISPAIKQLVREAHSDCADLASTRILQTPDLCLELLFDDQDFGSHGVY